MSTAELPSKLCHLQRKLGMPIQSALLRNINSALSERDQASLLSSAGDPHTFSTTPSSPILTLSNSQFSIFAGRRILQPIYPFSTVLKCPRCSKDMDPYGDHTFMCLTKGAQSSHQVLA